MVRIITRHNLLAVLAIALVLRLGILIALYPSLFAFERTGAIHGSGAYDLYAVNLLASGVYGKDAPGVADAHLPPLVSYLVAAVYATLGRSGFAVAVVNIAFDLITISALYVLCKRLLPDANAWLAPLVGLMYACYPYLIFQNLTLIDTPLYMALLYLWLLTFVLLRERPRFDRSTLLLAIASGVLLGLIALTRTNAVLLAPLLAIWFLFRRNLWQTTLRLAVVALVSALVITPWTIRNFEVFGEFVPIALNGGENLYQGNNALTVPIFRAGYDVQWVPAPDDVTTTVRIDRNDQLADAAWRYLRENPQAIPELMWTKFLIHWSIPVAPLRNPTTGEMSALVEMGDTQINLDTGGNIVSSDLPEGDPVNVYSSSLFDVVGRGVHIAYFGGLFALALAGYVLLRGRWRDVSLIWIVQFTTTVIYVLFHPATRYRVPTDPLLFVLSAWALITVVVWWQKRDRSPSAQVQPA